MKAVQLFFSISDDGLMKSVTVEYNDTGIPDEQVVVGLAEGIITNKKMNEAGETAKKILNKKRD